MRTTLNIDEGLLAEAQRASGLKTKTDVVEQALRLLVEQGARRRLAALAGQIPEAGAPARRQLGSKR